jgi:hypothetical protein
MARMISRSTRTAVAARLVPALVLSLAALGVPAAAVASQQSPTLTVEPGRASQNTHVVFDLPGVGPGYEGRRDLDVRNASGRTAAVTFTGFEFQGDGDASTPDLRDVTTVTLALGGTVIGRGGADSGTLKGSEICLPAGAQRTLASTVQIASNIGNRYQGGVLKVQYDFAVSTAPGACGIVAPDVLPDTLPPTGESLSAFTILVWAVLGSLDLLLMLWAVMVWRRRKDEAEAVAAQLRDVQEAHDDCLR